MDKQKVIKHSVFICYALFYLGDIMEETEGLKYIRFVKQNPENIKKISVEILTQHPEICFEIIKKNADNIKYVPMDVREKIPQLCIDAVKQNPENIKYIPEQVQIDNPQMCIDVIKKTKGLLYYISIDLLEQCPEICLEALLRDPECIEDIPEDIVDNSPQIQAMLEIMNNWEKINELSEDMLRENPQLCIEASLASKRKYKPSKELLYNNAELVEMYISEWRDLVRYFDTEWIIATKDAEYIKSCIMNKEKYISALNPEFAIYRLIEATGEKPQEIIKQLLDEKEKHDLTNSIIVSLIAQTKDADFTKSMIEKRIEYEFSSRELIFLIRNTEDIEFIKQCIERPQVYGLKEGVEELAKEVKSIPFIVDYVHRNFNLNQDEMKKIKLPPGMTIGIEIESEGELSPKLLQEEEIIKGWHTKKDKSLDNGVEIVSPVLKSENSNERPIYDICSILKSCGNYTSDNCGGHIHIGADYLKDINAWKNLLELWSNTENLLYIISNAVGETPRSEVYEYASPISQNIEEIMESGEIDLESEDDIQNFCDSILQLQGKNKNGSRYSGINFENFGSLYKNTIEFRLSNGTINPETWVENINLFGGIVAVSQELSVIQNKIENGIKLTEDEQNKIKLFEQIKSLRNEETNEEKKLECLLALAIDDVEHSTYLERYRVNKQKMGYSYIVKDVKPININKKQLGKLAFTGKDSVTGEEYKQGSSIIQSELDIDKMLDEVFSQID